jgi:NAD(P)-dependent dehydrogenase (short-subunit alcohol dehydrogenase family)
MDDRKSIVVTGGSSGIGRATVLRLSQKGWRVFATVRSRDDAEALQRLTNDAAEPLQFDVTNTDSIAAAALNVKTRLAGRGLDALFNNAGIGLTSPVEHTSPAALRRIFDVNLFGQIATIQAFLPLLRRAHGRIINTGSVGDHLTPPFAGPLAASKAAFASMTAALRLELRPQGIHVCLIEPGSINTPAVDKTIGAAQKMIADLPPEGARLYAQPMRRMTATLEKNERAGSPPDAVAKVVERALTDRRPRTRYLAGKDSRKLTALAWLLPEKLLDVALLQAFGLPLGFGIMASADGRTRGDP